MNAPVSPMHAFAGSMADSLASTLADSLPVHDATALTGGGIQARIVLHGQVYTLRITRAGKLILTK